VETRPSRRSLVVRLLCCCAGFVGIASDVAGGAYGRWIGYQQDLRRRNPARYFVLWGAVYSVLWFAAGFLWHGHQKPAALVVRAIFSVVLGVFSAIVHYYGYRRRLRQSSQGSSAGPA
jgi:CDP-diglyceride synthetase